MIFEKLDFITKKTFWVVLICCCVSFLQSIAIADLYQWQDDKGDIHVVDDILLVPAKYKDKAKKLKYQVSEPSQVSQPQTEPERLPQSSEASTELYGDYPLRRWKEMFDEMKLEISELEKTIAQEGVFISDYERGRRLYKLYSQEDTDKYETFKKNISDNETYLNELNSDLQEFRRKAKIYGVPSAVSGN